MGWYLTNYGTLRRRIHGIAIQTMLGFHAVSRGLGDSVVVCYSFDPLIHLTVPWIWIEIVGTEAGRWELPLIDVRIIRVRVAMKKFLLRRGGGCGEKTF